MSLALYDFRLRQRDYLLNVGRALVSNLSLRATLQVILRAAVEMLQGPVGLVALRHPDEATYDFWASYGLPPAQVDLFSPLLEDLSARQDGPQHLYLVPAATLQSISAGLGQVLVQGLALPMRWERDLLGVIFIFRTQPLLLTPDDRQILDNFTDFASIAVHNARLYQAVNQERQRLARILEHSADAHRAPPPGCPAGVQRRRGAGADAGAAHRAHERRRDAAHRLGRGAGAGPPSR